MKSILLLLFFLPRVLIFSGKKLNIAAANLSKLSNYAAIRCRYTNESCDKENTDKKNPHEISNDKRSFNKIDKIENVLLKCLLDSTGHRLFPNSRSILTAALKTFNNKLKNTDKILFIKSYFNILFSDILVLFNYHIDRYFFPIPGKSPGMGKY